MLDALRWRRVAALERERSPIVLRRLEDARVPLDPLFARAAGRRVALEREARDVVFLLPELPLLLAAARVRDPLVLRRELLPRAVVERFAVLDLLAAARPRVPALVRVVRRAAVRVRELRAAVRLLDVRPRSGCLRLAFESPDSLRLAVARAISLLKLLFCPRDVVSWSSSARPRSSNLRNQSSQEISSSESPPL